MFGDGALSFREFAMREPLPLATIHDAVLEFLRDRDDAALFGAQAVNAYVDEPRMTQDVDILSPRAEALAEEIRRFLNERFQIAVRVREVRGGIGYRVDQVRKPQNRHLVDVRPVEAFPPTELVERILVISPAELIAEKLVSSLSRGKKPKGLIDAADLRRLLLAFPGLKVSDGSVRERLLAAGVSEEVLAAWDDLVRQEIEAEDDADEFDY